MKANKYREVKLDICTCGYDYDLQGNEMSTPDFVWEKLELSWEGWNIIGVEQLNRWGLGSKQQEWQESEVHTNFHQLCKKDGLKHCGGVNVLFINNTDTVRVQPASAEIWIFQMRVFFLTRISWQTEHQTQATAWSP